MTAPASSSSRQRGPESAELPPCRAAFLAWGNRGVKDQTEKKVPASLLLIAKRAIRFVINAVSSRHHLNKPNRLCQEILLWIPAAIAHWKYLVAVLRRRDHPAIALRGDQKLSERMIAYNLRVQR